MEKKSKNFINKEINSNKNKNDIKKIFFFFNNINIYDRV